MSSAPAGAGRRPHRRCRAAEGPGVAVGVPAPASARRQLPGRVGVPRRRRRPCPQPRQRTGDERRHPGRVEPRLEDRTGRPPPGRPARLVRVGAAARRAAVLRFTDRLFSIATSTRLPVRTGRTYVVPHVAPLLRRLPGPVRAAGFRRVAELDVSYRRSAAVEDRRSRLARGLRAGDRLPDGPLHGPDGPTTLHRLVGPPGHHLLLLGSSTAWNPAAVAELERTPGVTVHLVRRGMATGGFRDETCEVWRRLHAGTASQYVIRPDGHFGFRADGSDIGPLIEWLARHRPTV